MKRYRRRDTDCPCCHGYYDKGLRALPARDARRLQDDGGDPEYDTVHPAELGPLGCCGNCNPDLYDRWYQQLVAAWTTDERARWPG